MIKLFKGNVIVTSRSSEFSLFDTKIATFDDDGGAYNQADAAGFIKLNALRMRIAGNRASKLAAGAKAKTRAKPAGSVKAAKSSAATKPSVAKKATKAAKPR
jgi:argininosuccinate synthase